MTTTSHASPPKDRFAHARNGLEALAASPWEWEVVSLLERHGEQEGELLERYQHYAETADSAAVRFLVRLIIEEERRHHETFAGLAEAIAWGASRREEEECDIPVLRVGSIDGDLRAETAALLAAERRDSAELRNLLHRMKSVRNTTVWALLVELVLDDTDKHIRILQFLEKNARRPARELTAGD